MTGTKQKQQEVIKLLNTESESETKYIETETIETESESKICSKKIKLLKVKLNILNTECTLKVKVN